MSLLEGLLLEPMAPKLGATFLDVPVYFACRGESGPAGSGTITDPWNASSRGSTGDYGTLLLSSLVANGSVATATTQSAHNFKEGERVTIAGVKVTMSSQANQHYMGTFTISLVVGQATKFTYTMLASPTNTTATEEDANHPLACWRERERFDGIAAQLPPKTLLLLGPGVIETRGYSGLAGDVRPRSGWRILGSGMGLTTIKLVTSATSPFKSFAFLVGETSPEHFEVADLTIDCNADGQYSQYVNCNGIACGNGLHTRIKRVRAINHGSLGPLDFYSEGFTIAASGKDVLFDSCVIESPSPNAIHNSTFLQMSSPATDFQNINPTFSEACIQRNNYINGEFLYGDVVYIQSIHAGSEVDGLTEITLTTKRPHGYKFPGNVSIAGITVGGSTNNRFNGVFAIKALDPNNPSILKYDVFVPCQALQEVSGTHDTIGPRAHSGAPISWRGYNPLVTYVDTTPVKQIFKIDVAKGKFLGPNNKKPHNLTLNNRFNIGNIWLRGYQDGSLIELNPSAEDNYCNGHFKVHKVLSKVEIEYITSRPTELDPISCPDYWINICGPKSHAMMHAESGTGSILERNRVISGATGVWHDTGTTKDITARKNYFYDVSASILEALFNFTKSLHIQIGLNGLEATITPYAQSPAPLPGLSLGQPILISGVVTGSSASNPYNGYFNLIEYNPGYLKIQLPEAPQSSIVLPQVQKVVGGTPIAAVNLYAELNVQGGVTTTAVFQGESVLNLALHDDIVVSNAFDSVDGFSNSFNGTGTGTGTYRVIHVSGDGKTIKYTMVTAPDRQPLIPTLRVLWEERNLSSIKNVHDVSAGMNEGYWGDPTAISTSLVPDLRPIAPYIYRRTVIRKNAIRQMNGKLDAYHWGVNISNTENLIVDKNTIDIAADPGVNKYPFNLQKVQRPILFANTQSDGKPFRGYDRVQRQMIGQLENLSEDVVLFVL